MIQTINGLDFYSYSPFDGQSLQISGRTYTRFLSDKPIPNCFMFTVIHKAKSKLTFGYEFVIAEPNLDGTKTHFCIHTFS